MSATPEGKHIIVIGDAFCDIFAPVDRLPTWGTDVECTAIQQLAGGSALNVAVHIGGLLKSRDTAQCSFYGLVANDDFGTLLRRRLNEAGVRDFMGTADEGTGTGVCIVFSGSADRAFVTQVGATGQLEVKHLEGVFSQVKEMANSRLHVHISGFFSTTKLRPGLAAFLQRLRTEAHTLKINLTTSLDTNCDALERWDGGVIPVLKEVDLFMPNETEARGIAGVGDLEEAADVLAKHVRSCVIITCGGEGTIVQTSNAAATGTKPCRKPALQGITPVDATGAGDAFDAGFVFRYVVDGASIDDAAIFGSCTGALCTQEMGGNVKLSSAETVEAAVARYKLQQALMASDMLV